jgi:hypothetical protein
MKEFLLLPFFLINGGLAPISQNISLNPCPYAGVATPSEETRPIRNQNPNFSFQIPKNYRALKDAYPDNNGLIHYISIIDEASHAFGECVNKVGAANVPGYFETYGMDGDDFPTITVSYRSGKFQNTQDLTKAVFGDIPEEVEPVGWTTVLGQKAFIYTHSRASDTVRVSFISPNKQYLITVSATAKIRIEEKDEMAEDGTVHKNHEVFVEGIENERVFQNIINSFAFSEAFNNSIVNNIQEIVKIKDFFKKQDVGNSYPYYVESFFSSGQPYPLYIVSEQFPYSRGSLNCYRGNGDRRMCPSFAYIPSGATYKEVWGTAMDVGSIVKLAPRRLNNMPCIETIEGKMKTTYCYNGNQYQPLAPTKR